MITGIMPSYCLTHFTLFVVELSFCSYNSISRVDISQTVSYVVIVVVAPGLTVVVIILQSQQYLASSIFVHDKETNIVNKKPVIIFFIFEYFKITSGGIIKNLSLQLKVPDGGYCLNFPFHPDIALSQIYKLKIHFDHNTILPGALL